MLKKMGILAGAAIVVGCFATGCVSDRPLGTIYTESTYDVQGNSGQLANLKVGTAEAKCYFGVVGLGDCSIDAATKNGDIKDVKYIDRSVKNLFGFSTITTKVYGN